MLDEVVAGQGGADTIGRHASGRTVGGASAVPEELVVWQRSLLRYNRVASSRMMLDRGSRVGPYEVVGTSGAGGMGEVVPSQRRETGARRRAQGPPRRVR